MRYKAVLVDADCYLEEKAPIIGGAGDSGMVGFGIREGHVGANRKVDRPRSHHPEFGSETASEAGSKRFELSQADEAVAGDLLLNCDIAGLPPSIPISLSNEIFTYLRASPFAV
jgi:hypothetical protein